MSSSKRWNLLSWLSSWLSSWGQDGSRGGFTLGAGVNERLVKGIADEVEGFSGREVCFSAFVGRRGVDVASLSFSEFRGNQALYIIKTPGAMRTV